MTDARHTLQDFVDVIYDPWAVTGIHFSHCFPDQRPDSPSAADYKTLSTRISVMIQDLFMLIIQFKLYCYPGNVLARLHCIKFDIVLFTLRCVITLDNCCKRCFISKFDQHLGVLGPCRMALELHLRMLGKVYSGFYCSYCLFLAGVVVVVTPSLCLQMFRFCQKSFEQHIRVLGPCHKARDKHLRMLGQAVARFYYSYYNDALEWNDLFLRREI